VNKLTNEKENNKEIKDDDAINEALSALGWQEEKEETPIEELTEQAQIIEKLNKKILELQKKNQELDALVKSNDQARQVEQIQSDYKEKISRLQERIDTIKAEKDEFMFKLGNAMKEKDEMIQSYELQIDQLNAQNQALLNRTALNQSFDDEIAVISAEKQELIRENTNLREEHTINRSKIKELENQNAQYHGELNNLKSEISEKNAKFTSLVQELEGYKNEFVNLKNRIVELEQKNQSLTEELSQKQFQISEESSQNVSYQEEIANKEAIIKDLKNQISEYSEQIQYMEADTVNRSEFEELKGIITNKDQVITTKEKKIFELEKEISDLRAYAEEQETKVKGLNQQLNEIKIAESEEDQLRDEIETLNKLVIEQNQQKQVLYDQVKKLKEAETGDQAIIQRLEKQIEEMRGSVIKENLELETLRSEKRRKYRK
jgi:chromosome segregation ATPase